MNVQEISFETPGDAINDSYSIFQAFVVAFYPLVLARKFYKVWNFNVNKIPVNF